MGCPERGARELYPGVSAYSSRPAWYSNLSAIHFLGHKESAQYLHKEILADGAGVPVAGAIGAEDRLRRYVFFVDSCFLSPGLPFTSMN